MHQTRIETLQLINKVKGMFFGNPDKAFDKEKICAILLIEEGVNKRKAREIIKALIDTNFIKEDEFGLWLNTT